MSAVEVTDAREPELVDATNATTRRWLPEVLGGLAAAVGGLAVAAWALRLWRASPRVPLFVGGDAYLTLDGIKNMQRGAWYFTTDLLGAPFGQKLFDFPAPGDAVNLLLVKALGIVTSDPVVTMNVFFVLTFPLAALAAYAALRVLRVNVAIAAALGVAYSVLPYHFQRGEPHLFLSAYFAVPLASVVIIRQMRSSTMVRLPRRGVPVRATLFCRTNLLAAGVTVLVAGTGLYYAFFFVLLLVIVGVTVSARDHRWEPLLSTLVLVALVGGIVAVANIPVLLYRSEHGANSQVAKRLASDSDTYGLRIADLVLPTYGHRVHALAELKNESMGGPVPSEGTEALGIVGAIGYVGLLGVGFSRLIGARRRAGASDDRATFVGQLAGLTILSSVLAAIAGGALVIGVLGLAEFRAWNRISVYIAFFAFAGVGIWLTIALERRLRAARPLMLASIAIAVGLVVFTAFDQTAPRFVPNYVANSRQWGMDAAFVADTEHALGRSASIFQLPYVPFPENPPVVGMTDYDHLRGYVHSDTLHWSYGGVKGREVEWQPALMAQPTAEAIVGMAAAGFDGLYVNRSGYADHAAQLEQGLVPLLGEPVVESTDGSLAMFDLRPVHRRLARELPASDLERLRASVLHPATAAFGAGFYGEEGDGTSRWRWGTSEGEVVLTNPGNRSVSARLSFGVDSPDDESRVKVSGLPGKDVVLPAGADIDRVLELRPGRTVVRMRSDAAPQVVPGDTRDLRFRVTNFRVTPADLEDAAAGPRTSEVAR